MSLDSLNARVREDLEALALGHVLDGTGAWPKPKTYEGHPVYDAVIVGGGQSGLGAAFGLKRERIANILVIDENPPGLEGPWATYARMVTLRTPKALTAIDYGISSLTFRAYWQARAGKAAWDAIDKIPRGDWMDYLRWYREVLDLPVQNGVKLLRIEPTGGLYRLQVEGGGTPVLYARKVILATGIQGGGAWHVPPAIVASLPASLYAHTSQAIDFDALKGRRIGILGAGASSFDNANHALSHGVAEAHVFVRRKALPRINPIRHMEAVNLLPRFASLADADKYGVIAHFFTHSQPPTNDTFQRAASHPGFHLHLGAPWLSVARHQNQAVVTTPQGTFAFDFLIISTGLVSDPALRPELASFAGDILRWGDVYEAPPETKNPLIDAHPYLAKGFALQGRDEAATERLRGIFVFNYSALASFGLSAAALSGLKHALPRLTQGVADQIFADDREALLGDYYAYAEAEFTADQALPELDVPEPDVPEPDGPKPDPGPNVKEA